jgi:UDP-N-acetyl-D-glucosamine dehydrogenase
LDESVTQNTAVTREERISIAPDGTRYCIPDGAEIAASFSAIEQRATSRRVTVVQGLGFVGAAVAATIADARDANGLPHWFVIGIDLPTEGGFWRIGKFNEGRAPFGSPDPVFDRLVRTGMVRGNLCATASTEAYSLADVIVVDVQLDVINRDVQSPKEIQIDLAAFESAIRVIGQRMKPDALVLIETTVPFGTTERVVLPTLRAERDRRGITKPVRVAHVPERVMPGPRYIDSIRGFWRNFAGIDAESTEMAREFLSTFIDTTKFPPWQLSDPSSSEFSKILENSYRAANIALIYEWTLLAEKAEVDLWAIVDSIRIRKGTHDNMRYPGFGVGGYCLTKDALLAQWSATKLLRTDVTLPVTLNALSINYRMPLHTLDLLRELTGDRRSQTVGLCGISYLPDVGDTRHSPAEVLVDTLLELGSDVRCHDPCVQCWSERPDVTLTSDVRELLHQVDAVIFAVPHTAYRELSVEDFPSGLSIIDANNVIDDRKAHAVHTTGSRLLGVGKGHWRKRGYHLAG